MKLTQEQLNKLSSKLKLLHHVLTVDLMDK